MFISENMKIFVLDTHCMSIFLEYILEKGVCLFGNSNDVCYVW